MGNVFDCAVNPLHPMPEDGGAEAGANTADSVDAHTHGHTLEKDIPLRNSILWALQRAYYSQEGLSAWSKNVVPSFVTSNSYIGRAYARLILGLLKDTFTHTHGNPADSTHTDASAAPVERRNPNADYTQPINIVELGAGHGKLSYIIVENLCRYAALFPKTETSTGYPFRYIITDCVKENVQKWREHPNLQQFINLGILDVAVFDAEKDSEIKCEVSGAVVSAATNFNPMFVIANYVFDTLPCDAFRISGGVLEQVNLTLSSAHSADKPPAAPSADMLRRAQPSWTYSAIGKPGPSDDLRVYNEPILDSMLTAYVESASLKDAGMVLMPLGSIVALRSLLKMSRGRMVVMSADKGYTRLSEMKGHRDPPVSRHGSVSFMVNYHALRQLAKAFGGYTLHTPQAEGFKCVAFAFGDASKPPAAPLGVEEQPAPAYTRFPIRRATAAAAGGEPAAAPVEAVDGRGFEPDDDEVDGTIDYSGYAFPNLRWAYNDFILGFTPEDFSTLQRCIHEEAAPDHMSLKHALALLRLSNHDAHVFYKFRDTIVLKSAQPSAGESVQHDVRNDVDRIYASYYPLEEGKDVCFELGRLLMGLRDYGAAIDFFQHSLEICGHHHVTYHNMGLCYYYLDELERALACFKRSLEIKSDYGEARLWWEKTATRAGFAVDGAGGTAAGDEDTFSDQGDGGDEVLDTGDLRTDDPSVLRDESDAFAAVSALGHTHMEYDPELDAYTSKFKRDEVWKEALTSIRKLLKKYHDHIDLPARVWLSKLSVVESRLVPIMQAYSTDKEMLYEIGKILVFLTMPIKVRSRCPASTRATLVSYMRETCHALCCAPDTLTSMLSLLQPALDADKREKSDRDVHAVDLVVTLLKQLLEVPNTADGASAPHTTEELVLMFEREGMFPIIVSLCKLVDRREFNRLALVLLDFFFQALRGQRADDLFKAFRATRGAGGSRATAHSNARVHTPAKPVEAAAATARFVAAGNADELLRVITRERAARTVDDLRSGITRHSRFGTNVIVKELGASRVISQPFKLTGAVVDDSTAVRRRKTARVRVPKDSHQERFDMHVEVPLRDGVGAGDSITTGIVEDARAALFRLVLQLVDVHAAETDSDDDEASPALSSFAVLMTALKQKFLRDTEDLAPEDALKYLHVGAVVCGCVRLQQSDAVKTKNKRRTTPSAATTERSASDVLPEPSDLIPIHRADSLAVQLSQPSLPVTAPAPAQHSLLTRPASRTKSSTTDAAVDTRTADEKAPRDVPGIDAKEMAVLLDRWSMGRLAALVDSYAARKQWLALTIVADHLKEIMLLIYALETEGKPSSYGRDLGHKLLEGLVRDGDVLALLPRMLRMWEPGRFDPSFVLSLIEASHYALKLVQRANEGRPHRPGKSKRAADDDERALELTKLIGEFAHPTVLQAYNTVLRTFKLNAPRYNYYVVNLFRRIETLPNEMAGKHPTTGEPFTFQVMLFNVALLETAAMILDSTTMQRGQEHADTRNWAKQFSAAFLRETEANPLLFVEALFWRHEKSANAELSRRYGLLDGHLLRMDGDDGAARRKSKRALDADAAEAEARRNAVRIDDEGDENQFDDDDVNAPSTRVHKGRRGASRLQKSIGIESDDEDSLESFTPAEDATLRAITPSYAAVSAAAAALTGLRADHVLAEYLSREPVLLRACESHPSGDHRLVSRARAISPEAFLDDSEEDVLAAVRARIIALGRGVVATTGSSDAVEWVIQGLRAARRMVGVGGGSASLREHSPGDALTRALSPTPALPLAGDVALTPVSDVEFSWFSDQSFTRFLRILGVCPPASHRGEQWWRVPAVASVRLLDWLDETLRAVLLSAAAMRPQ